MRAYDAFIADAAAHCLRDYPALRELMAGLSQSNFSKALLFAPFLLIAWYRVNNDPFIRPKVLATVLSCAFGLFFVWCVTSTWIRLRPLDPHAGHELVSRSFLSNFGAHSRLLRWGCFPSDHAAYLTALSLGLYVLNKKVGIASIVVAVLFNSTLRLAVGLHYISDILVGIAFGFFAHWLTFSLIAFPQRNVTAKLVHTIDRSYWMQLLLLIGVVEMATLFQDIRALDTLIFGN